MSRIKKSQIHLRAISDAELCERLDEAVVMSQALFQARASYDFSVASVTRQIEQEESIERYIPLIYQFDDFALTVAYAEKLGLPRPVPPDMTGRNKRRAIQPPKP